MDGWHGDDQFTNQCVQFVVWWLWDRTVFSVHSVLFSDGCLTWRLRGHLACIPAQMIQCPTGSAGCLTWLAD